MIRLKVKEIAERKNVGIARLSRLSDLDVKVIRKIFRGPETANPTLDTLNRIAFALRVDARDLIEYTRDDSLPGLPEDDEEESV